MSRVTAAAAASAERTHLSFDGDDASIHERGVLGQQQVQGWDVGSCLWHVSLVCVGGVSDDTPRKFQPFS